MQVVSRSANVVYCAEDAATRLKQCKNINNCQLVYRLDDVSTLTHSSLIYRLVYDVHSNSWIWCLLVVGQHTCEAQLNPLTPTVAIWVQLFFASFIFTVSNKKYNNCILSINESWSLALVHLTDHRLLFLVMVSVLFCCRPNSGILSTDCSDRCQPWLLQLRARVPESSYHCQSILVFCFVNCVVGSIFYFACRDWKVMMCM